MLGVTALAEGLDGLGGGLGKPRCKRGRKEQMTALACKSAERTPRCKRMGVQSHPASTTGLWQSPSKANASELRCAWGDRARDTIQECPGGAAALVPPNATHALGTALPAVPVSGTKWLWTRPDRSGGAGGE